MYFVLCVREVLQLALCLLPLNVFDDEVFVVDGNEFDVLMGIERLFLILAFPVQVFLFVGLPLLPHFEVPGLALIDHVGVELGEFLAVHVDGGDGALVLEVVVFDIPDEAVVDFPERLGFLHGN